MTHLSVLDGRLGGRASELLDIRRDVVIGVTPDRSPKAFLVAPDGESLDGFEVSAAGIWVADVDGKGLPEPPAAIGRILEDNWQRWD